MKPEIHGIFCAEVKDLEAFEPHAADQFYLPLDLNIGEAGTKRSDLFGVVVTTQQAISAKPDRQRSKLLVVRRYEWSEIRRTLERWVSDCEGPDWPSVVECLRRRFTWEYEKCPPP